MSDGQEELIRVVGRYRTGRCEAAYTAQLVAGLLSTLDPHKRNGVLDYLWSQLSTDFEKAITGESITNWIFPVTIPCWVKFGDTAVMTKRLLGMLAPSEQSVAKAWTTHLAGFLCDALYRHYNRFAPPTIAYVEAWVGQLKFAIGTGIKDYQFEPELTRAVNRISDIIEDKHSEPLDAALLAASNAAGSGADPHQRLLVRENATRDDDYNFCRLAIGEARRSIAEGDERIHPKVGAVVVKDGHVLAVAHRGEFPGCHAEYIALEKKLRDIPVSGATVYTTLEPCTSRKHPKIPCASRLLERRVARVVIGMLDPNPAITGKGQLALRTGGVSTVLFPSDLMAEVEELNREFWRAHDVEGEAPGGSQGAAKPRTPSLIGAGRTHARPKLTVRYCERFGDEARQLLHGLTVDPKGNLIIVGDLYGSMDFGGPRLTSAGDRDIFVAKFDHNGNHIWSRRYGDQSEKVGVGVGADATGAIFVLSAFTGTLDFGGKPLVSKGRYNVALARLDQAGHLLWSRSFGDDKYHAPECIAVTPSGQVVIAGRFQGSIDFGGGRLQSQSNQTDIFLAAFSRDGEFLWAKRFGGPFEQQTRSVAMDENGNIALTGVFKGTINFDDLALSEQRPGDYCGFLAKLDEGGNASWCKRFGDPYVEQGGAVTFDRRNGDIITAGAIRNKLPPSDKTRTGVCVLARYDTTGVLRWSKSFGPHAWPTSLAVASDGRILLTGHFEKEVDFGLGILASAGGYDIFAAMFTAEGNTLWSKRFGDRRQQFLVQGEHGRDGSIVLAGSFHGTIDFGAGPLIASGYDGMQEGMEDVFLVVLEENPRV